MDIKKYKEFVNKLFNIDLAQDINGIGTLTAFNPINLDVCVDGERVHGFTPDIKILGTPEEFEINLQITSAWAFAFLDNEDEILTVGVGYKEHTLFKHDMRVLSSLKFQYEIPTVNVKFKKVWQ